MNKKNKIIVSITGILLVLLILVGLTYGYYLTRISGNTSDKSISIDMANLELTYSDGNGLIEAKSIIPGETIATKTFTVKNTGNAKVSNYVVYLDSVVNNFEDKNDLKLTLTCTSDIGNCNGTNITYPSTNTMLVTNDIEEKETQSYELKVEFIETNDDQSDNMNKEMSGNILIKDIKGLNNTLDNIKGTNNLVVENGKLLSNYRIYGNSFQETRSGKNLLNVNGNMEELSKGGTTVSDGKIIVKASTYAGAMSIFDYISVTPSETINISYDMIQGLNRTAFKIYDKDKNLINDSSISIANFTYNSYYEGYYSAESNVSFIIPNDIYYIRILMTGMANNDNINSIYYNYQVEKGNIATEYEKYGATPSPDYPSEIQSVGDLVTDTNDTNYGKYKIPIKVTGKNLLNLEYAIARDSGGLNLSKNADGSLNLKGNLTSKFIYYGAIQKQYIKSGTSIVTTGYFTGTTDETYIGVVLYNKNKGIIKQFNSIKSGETGTFNLTEDCYYVGIVWRLPNSNVGDYYEINNIKIQLEENTSSTEYEPYQEEIYNIYLDEPLRKIDNYSDYIDFKSGKVVRKTKYTNLSIKDMNNNDNYPGWNNVEQNLKTYFDNYNTSLNQITKIMNNIVKNSAIFINTSSTNTIIGVTKTVTGLTQTEWQTNYPNLEFHLIYGIPNQEEELIILPTINLNSTKNYISIGTSTNPSNIELEVIK